MPCFDKKLEGSRDDFFDSDYKTRDVDCVITTDELVHLLEDEGPYQVKGGFAELEADDVQLDARFWNVSSDGQQLVRVVDTGGSGGYLEAVYRYAAKELFGIDLQGAALEYTRPGRRNRDLLEVQLKAPSSSAASAAANDGNDTNKKSKSKPLLRFARAYGFRNIQNIVRKMKQGKCPYDYVEIMACPSGCMNGGGQIRSDDARVMARRALVDSVQQAYLSLPSDSSAGGASQLASIRAVYSDWIGDVPGSDAAVRELHTQFHDVAAASDSDDPQDVVEQKKEDADVAVTADTKPITLAW
eukprot:TRINITY_DN59905_c0_g1_i3.p1 TRINITY_DN59905_c0_g1~~TRINITY_DN59905_c0_g1_i3.p1  ORF type:complete len:300 (+),score=122.19 TRINITY_DN59905_c0_g1_i3:937-1836(+)